MAALSDAAMLTLWNEAAQALATGQSYAINGRMLTRVDSSAVRKWLEFYEARVRASGTSPADQGFGLVSFNGPGASPRRCPW